MKNRLSYRLFCAGVVGAVISGMFLDGMLWGPALICLAISVLVGVIGYATMDVDLALKELEPKSIKNKKEQNRERTYQAWIATKKIRL